MPQSPIAAGMARDRGLGEHRRSPWRWLPVLVAVAALAACAPENVAYRYRVFGHTYSVLRNADHYDETGIASWYGPTYQGRPTASGQVYDMYQMTAASKVLPFYSYARVTNLENGQSEVVLINDRGPFYPGRIIDLSYESALAIGMERQGTTRVRVQVLPHYRVSTAAPAVNRTLLAAVPAEQAAAAPAGPVAAGAPAQAAPAATMQPAAVGVAPAQSPATQAPASRPPPTRLPAAPSGDLGMFLQAGLFTVSGDAQRLRGELQARGVGPVRLRPATYGGQPATIVVVGPLTGVDAVRAAQAALSGMGIQSIPYSP